LEGEIKKLIDLEALVSSENVELKEEIVKLIDEELVDLQKNV
jgi:hypothetical protein